MIILGFIVHLLGGAMLLLFSVRFMRVGIERLWSETIRSAMRQSSSIVALLAKGTILGGLMQGSTVVILMAAGLVGAGITPALSAIILSLGADFGSALAALVLTLPISEASPLALLAGGWLYLNGTNPRRRNFGRVVLGLGLILLSLSLIREAVEPLKSYPGTYAIVSHLNSDPISAALVAIGLSLLMHSGLAAVLTGVAFASHGDLNAVGGLAFVLGCNVGSALLPVWLLRRDKPETQLVPKAVALLRILPAIVVLAALNFAQPWFDDLLASFGRANHLMLASHAGYNVLLLLLAPVAGLASLPFASQLGRSSTRNRFALPEFQADSDILLSALRGQATRMLDTLGAMFDEASRDLPDTERVNELETQMNAALSDFRAALIALPRQAGTTGEAESQDIEAIMDFAIRLESCGDIISDKYIELRARQSADSTRLSKDGQGEIDQLVIEVRKGILLAQSVLWQGDEDTARRLVEHKQLVSGLEEESRRNHLARLRSGNMASLGSSNTHLELITALKAVNSKLATVGYAVLDTYGALKKTRLKKRETGQPVAKLQA